MRVQLGNNLNFMVRTKNSSFTPTAPDSSVAPTFAAYHGDSDSAMTNGTGSMTVVGGSTSLYRYSLPCTGGNGYVSGESYTIEIQYTIASAVRSEIITFYVD